MTSGKLGERNSTAESPRQPNRPAASTPTYVATDVETSDEMSLTESIGVTEEEQTGSKQRGRRWLTAAAVIGGTVMLYLFSLYAPPVIRRALGKESAEE